MNLVISGAIDQTLLTDIIGISDPLQVTRLHESAYRLEVANDSLETRSTVSTICNNKQVDHAYVEEGLRLSQFKLLAIDMDSTLITIECIDEIAACVGKKKEVAAITASAMEGCALDFAETLRSRVALLKGTNAEVLKYVFDKKLALSPGATELIAAARQLRITTMLITGGFTYFADRLRDNLGLDQSHANKLEIRDGKLTGKLLGLILDGRGKRTAVDVAMKAEGVTKKQVLVVGDGANDIAMMQAATYSISYHGHAKVNESAKIQIKYQTLAAILDFFPIS